MAHLFTVQPNAGPSSSSNVSRSNSQSLAFFPNNTLYALKKRFIIPQWWLTGVLHSLGSKEVWYDCYKTHVEGKKIVVHSQLTTKDIPLFLGIWHELFCLLFEGDPYVTDVSVSLKKYIHGTQAQLLEKCQRVEKICVSTFDIVHLNRESGIVKRGRKKNSSALGHLNFIRQAKTLMDPTLGPVLQLSLAQPLIELFSPKEQGPEEVLSGLTLSSIQSAILHSLGSRPNSKKLLYYLFLEFSKRTSLNQNILWHTSFIHEKNIAAFHKQMIGQAGQLYDHGVIGWDLISPAIRVSKLREMTKGAGSLICCLSSSLQANEANQLEEYLSRKILELDTKKQIMPNMEFVIASASKQSATLFPEPPRDELKSAREKSQFKTQPSKESNHESRGIKDTIETTVISPLTAEYKETSLQTTTEKTKDVPIVENVLTCKKEKSSYKNYSENLMHPTLFAEPPKERPRILQTTTPLEKLNDHEFIVLVSEFYDSLKPIQKKAFERERARMTPQYFRLYMTSILQRRRIELLDKERKKKLRDNVNDDHHHEYNPHTN